MLELGLNYNVMEMLQMFDGINEGKDNSGFFWVVYFF